MLSQQHRVTSQQLPHKLAWPTTYAVVALGTGAGLASNGTSAVLAVLVPVGAVAVAIVVRRGLRALLVLTMAAVALTAPWTGLRLVGVLTLSDILLFMAACLLVQMRASVPVVRSFRLYRPFLISACLISLGGLIGTLLGGQDLSGGPDLIRFMFSTIGVLVVIAVWSPTKRDVCLMAWMYSVGSAFSVLLGIFVFTEPSGRTVGLSIHPNHFAMIGLLGLGAAGGLALSGEGWPRWFAAGIGSVLLAGLVTSGSRAGALGAAVFFVTLLVTTRSWKAVRWSAALTAAFALLVVLGVVELSATSAISRVLGQDTTVADSDQSRALVQADSLRIIGSAPLTGVGFAVAKEAHNVYLQLWAASGLLGLAGGVGLVFAAVQIMRKREKRDLLGTCMLCSYFGYLAAAYFSNIFADRYLWLYLGLTLAWFEEGIAGSRQKSGDEEMAGLSSGDGPSPESVRA